MTNPSSPASLSPSAAAPATPSSAGTVNTDGRLVVRVAKTGGQTALAQIVRLVEKAQSSKPPVQKLADQISAVFVPAVLGIALVTGARLVRLGARPRLGGRPHLGHAGQGRVQRA